MIIGIIVILFLVYFLIVRPLTQRNRPQIYEPGRRGYYDNQRDYYGTGQSGFGRFGTFAGGIAAGALLSYLFNQGRIGFDQYQAMQNMEDHDIMRELMDQNIIQEDEIARLQEELGTHHGDATAGWDDSQSGDSFNQRDYGNGHDSRDYGSYDEWDTGGGDDNWV